MSDELVGHPIGCHCATCDWVINQGKRCKHGADPGCCVTCANPAPEVIDATARAMVANERVIIDELMRRIAALEGAGRDHFAGTDKMVDKLAKLTIDRDGWRATAYRAERERDAMRAVVEAARSFSLGIKLPNLVIDHASWLRLCAALAKLDGREINDG